MNQTSPAKGESKMNHVSPAKGKSKKSPINRAPTCTRRRLIQGAAAIAGASVISGCATRTSPANAAARHPLLQDDVILFQGDSITDAGRDKDNSAPSDFGALGRGYANMITMGLLGAHPSLRLHCYNRGISGHKVPDLEARWQKDTLDLKPAVLSILIGVNDIWHKLDGRYSGTVADYERQFASLLAGTRAALPQTRLVICEPFVLRCGAVNEGWFPEFDERRAAAKRVAENAAATWVPFQTMFDETLTDATPSAYWARDGVHPTTAGHALMAKTWLTATGLG